MFFNLYFLIVSIYAFIPNNPLTPMLGWSSWNTFKQDINETLIQETADAMVKSGLKDAGYRYINIDDGFFYPRNAQGEFQYNKTKFPSGMRALADYIHDLGLNAGIYSDAGSDTCGTIWDNQDAHGCGLEGHEEADAKLFFQDWDYDFIKVDFCGGNVTGMDEKEEYTKIHEALVKAQPPNKPEIRYNLCRWIFPGSWATEIAGSWRIFADIVDDFVKDDRSVVSVMKQNLYLSAYASPGHFNDMDMMEIGRGTFTEDEERAHFGLWSILSSPILIGCDLRVIPDSTVKIITNPEVLAVHQDVLGLQAKVISKGSTNVVLAKPLEDAHGTIRAVALFNWAESPATLSVSFQDVLLEGPVAVRDLFARQDLGVFRDAIEATVGPHSILLLRLEGGSTFDKVGYDSQDIFLHDFTMINPGKSARLVESSVGSSGLKITSLGNSSTNWGEFRDVYSSTGGTYQLTIVYYSEPQGRDLDVYVNGVHHRLSSLQSADLNTRESTVLTITLNRGSNVVRLAREDGPAPDIDLLIFRPL